MTATLESIRANQTVAAAMAREEKSFFGQGWSHYEIDFNHLAGGLAFHAFAYNTPNHIQINWNIREAGANEFSDCLVFAMTPEESRALAAELGVPIGPWLDAALEACKTDITADSLSMRSGVVDLPNFHAGRSHEA